MFRILRKTIRSSPTEQYDVVADADLSSWEFVDASQSDAEELSSFDGGDVVNDEDDVISGEIDSDTTKEEERVDERESHDSVPPDDAVSIQILSISPPMTFPVEATRHHVDRDYEAEEEEDDDDVDDELFPWKMKDRFVKQRIMKLGKRSKANKSKRLPHYQNRPGCLYGKHGLGVQHSYI